MRSVIFHLLVIQQIKKIILTFFYVSFFSLTVLEINQCKIAEVHNLAFNGLGTLRSLKLGDNNLSEVPSEALRRVPNLHSIHLDRNPFETLASDALTPVCSQLKRLDISGCSKLTSIQSHAFQGKKTIDFELKCKSQQNFWLSYVPSKYFLKIINLFHNWRQKKILEE